MRRMRIVPWRSRVDRSQQYSLVMEWFRDDGKCWQDMWYPMDPGEFEALKESVEAAAKEKDHVD